MKTYNLQLAKQTEENSHTTQLYDVFHTVNTHPLQWSSCKATMNTDNQLQLLLEVGVGSLRMDGAEIHLHNNVSTEECSYICRQLEKVATDPY